MFTFFYILLNTLFESVSKVCEAHKDILSNQQNAHKNKQKQGRFTACETLAFCFSVCFILHREVRGAKRLDERSEEFTPARLKRGEEKRSETKPSGGGEFIRPTD